MPTVYVTAPRDRADDISRTLVEERLAACVNRVDCESVYRWEGEIHDDDETIMLVKTTEDAVEAVERRIAEIHPDEVPCIERFDEVDLLAGFANWREEVVGD